MWTVYHPQLKFIIPAPLTLRRDDTGYVEESSRLDTIEEQSLVSEFCHFATPSPFLFYISVPFNGHSSNLSFHTPVFVFSLAWQQ